MKRAKQFSSFVIGTFKAHWAGVGVFFFGSKIGQ
jgi:hypothetical protein